MNYFGTDGIRGEVFKDLDYNLALICGNAIGRRANKIIIGRDTRLSGKILSEAFCLGANLAGASVVDIGVATTPCVSYLTKLHNFSYGIVISASHNPPKYNGIKVFNNLGKKLTQSDEEAIEQDFNNMITNYASSAKTTKSPRLINDYIKFLLNSSTNLAGINVCVDCANGASKNIAKKVFKTLNANVFYTGIGSGKNINKECGATFQDNIINFTKKHNADIGFAFDGDADRIIMVDSLGKLYSGDNILLGLSEQFNAKKVVGTTFSNLGLQKTLEQKNIEFIRADVGDKWVALKMEESKAIIGGEQSGHIILPGLPTGDGLYVALQMCNFYKKNKSLKSLEFKEYPQVIKNVSVKNKQIINSKNFTNALNKITLNFNGRIIVRPSGTENKIRVMVEYLDKVTSENTANKIVELIKQEQSLCAE